MVDPKAYAVVSSLVAATSFIILVVYWKLGLKQLPNGLPNEIGYCTIQGQCYEVG
jgi:hypothetical protein